MARVIGQGDIDATELKLGIVVSMFNDQITKKMLDGALTTAREMGIAEEDITVCWVAGAFELALVAQDVEQVLPDLVVTGADGFKAIDYSKLPMLTIEAVKELKNENDELKRRLAEVERLLGEMLAGLDRR